MNLEVLFWSDSQQLELLRTEGRVLEALMNAMDDAGIELHVASSLFTPPPDSLRPS